MPDLAARFVATVFTVCGLATLLAVPASPLFSDTAGTQQQLMQIFAGGLLAVAAWVRPLQAPAIGTALLTKLLFVAACVMVMSLLAPHHSHSQMHDQQMKLERHQGQPWQLQLRVLPALVLHAPLLQTPLVLLVPVVV